MFEYYTENGYWIDVNCVFQGPTSQFFRSQLHNWYICGSAKEQRFKGPLLFLFYELDPHGPWETLRALKVSERKRSCWWTIFLNLSFPHTIVSLTSWLFSPSPNWDRKHLSRIGFVLPRILEFLSLAPCLCWPVTDRTSWDRSWASTDHGIRRCIQSPRPLLQLWSQEVWVAVVLKEAGSRGFVALNALLSKKHSALTGGENAYMDDIHPVSSVHRLNSHPSQAASWICQLVA